VLWLEAQTRLGELELDVALEVQPGRCLALAGPSGAGKTSILRIVAGLMRPHRGRVTCDDRVWLDTEAGTFLAPERRAVGYLFQEHALFAHLSAWRNVAYPLRTGDRRARAMALLERFGVAHLADARPATLSGGERQRVALARALARTPEVLLLDEPLSALDTTTRAAASRELAAVLRETGVPALLVTHDFAEAALLGDEIGVIQHGRVVQRGTAAHLAASPSVPFVADFAGAVVLTGTARPGGDGLTLVDLDGGGSVASTDPGEGPVAVSVFPWEISVAPAGTREAGSSRNHLDAEVVSVTPVANRVRLGLLAGQPLTAELTGASTDALGLTRGTRVVATWKAAATRVLPVRPPGRL
jgi:molybdate transport system ATP-binding protein